MRVHRNPTVKVDANQNPTTVNVDQNPVAVDADQSLITSVAETTGRVAAKVTNVLGSLTGALKSRRNKRG
jgi:hypothetical protein